MCDGAFPYKNPDGALNDGFASFTRLFFTEIAVLVRNTIAEKDKVHLLELLFGISSTFLRWVFLSLPNS